MDGARNTPAATSVVIHKKRARRLQWFIFGLPLIAVAFAPALQLSWLASMALLALGLVFIVIALAQEAILIEATFPARTLAITSASWLRGSRREVAASDIARFEIVPCGFFGVEHGRYTYKAEAKLASGENVELVPCTTAIIGRGAAWTGVAFDAARRAGEAFNIEVVEIAADTGNSEEEGTS